MYKGAVSGTFSSIRLENARRELNRFMYGRTQVEMLTLAKVMSNVTVVTTLKGCPFLMKTRVQTPPIAKTRAVGRLIQKASGRIIHTIKGSANPETDTAPKNNWLSQR